jgi:hypothetical protein
MTVCGALLGLAALVALAGCATRGPSIHPSRASTRARVHYSYEAVELLKDIEARWDTARRIRKLAGCATNPQSPVCTAMRVPDAEIYAIDVSFPALPDRGTRFPESAADFVRIDARGCR